MNVQTVSAFAFGILSTVTASFTIDKIRERNEIRKKAKLFLYKLRESRRYILIIKASIENPQQDNFVGISVNASVSMLLENKPPDDLVIFDEGVLEQVEEYFTTIKRFVCEFQNFLELENDKELGNDKREDQRSFMIARAEEAIIVINLCNVSFLRKYFNKSHKPQIKIYKSRLQHQYKQLKGKETRDLEELNLDAIYNYEYITESGKQSKVSEDLTLQSDYYSEYTIKNIERVFKYFKWEVER